MPFQVSPGVNVSEIDLTTVIPAVSSTEGAIAGNFEWGPVDQRVLISSEARLVNVFGKPSSAASKTDWFTAANFLAYGNALYVVRVVGSALNASSGTTGQLIQNETVWENSTGLTEKFYAKYPGTKGNGLTVGVCDSTDFSGWGYEDDFDSAPDTGNFHVVVIDTDGGFTGTAGQILEKYSNVSNSATAKKDDGGTNHGQSLINQQSPYIWVGADLVSADDEDLDHGTDATGTVTTANKGYNLFASAEDVDISFILGSGNSSTVAAAIIDIAESRKDCLACISPEKSDVVNVAGSEASNITAFKTAINKSSSYAVMDSGWKYQYDKYNDAYLYTPLNGDTAGLMVQTDNTRDPWYSPAGFNRGNIKNIVRLAYNPDKADRDVLYKAGVNPVVTFPGQGTVLYGDKTMLSKPSAFDRINVRRLFIVLEKAISTASKYTLFEFNDEFTRSQFRNMVEPFLRDVQGRRGITDFRVVCDSTNNTGEIIDRNEFVGDIYIKPARSINFIQLNFVAVRTGVEFSEVVGKFG